VFDEPFQGIRVAEIEHVTRTVAGQKPIGVVLADP
jgi:hypothetical protein